MAGVSIPSRLVSDDALKIHLEALALRDPRLAMAIEKTMPVALRTGVPGFEGLARIVCGQQLSVASARAIWGRVEALGATSASAYLSFDESRLRATGLSRAKHETIAGLARAIEANRIDCAALGEMDAESAIKALTALKGIGPWTAEIYLLFCTGHPDIFPAGDLALQKAAGHALGLEIRPSAKALIGLARDWSPHRGAAAIMLWRYFSIMKQSDAWDAL